MFVDVCSILYLCIDRFCRFYLRKSLHLRRVLKYAFAYDRVWSFRDDPSVVDRMFKLSY